MILLPVIERELRVAARSRQNYRNRFFAALGITAVLLWVIYEDRNVAQVAMGNELFDYITYTSLCVALLAGFFYTADCISEERREGTLGLLYLTDLRGLHVVIGKLVANSIPAFFALATIVPVLAIPFLLGGISPGELERASLILLNALWLSLASGLLASALVKDDRTALLTTFGLIAIPLILAPIFHEGGLSAFWAMGASRDNIYLGRKDAFWTAMIQQFALPFFYVSLASIRARVIWREKPPTPAGERRRARWRIWSGGAPEQRKEWRTAMLEENPALWLACRHRQRTALLWAVLGIGCIWLTWIYYVDKRVDPLVGTIASIAFHWVLKITFAFASCRALSEESRNGAFELLFTTDLSPSRLVNGHLMGLVRSFGPAVAVVITLDILWAMFGRTEGFFADTQKLIIGRTAILVVDLATIALYGMWFGFKLRRSGRAAVWTLLLIVVAPNAAWLFLFTGSSSFVPVFVTWFAVDIAIMILAKANLKTLRGRASQRFVSNFARE
jgi:ABC-type transport system involved in cytochrome c biogenesis permease component